MENNNIDSANRFFDSHKITFSGINAGNYLDEEDFINYSENVSKSIYKYEGNLKLYEKAITSLTPGGSEFVNDPEYCAKYVKDNQDSLKIMLVNQAKEKKKLKKERDLLIEALENMVNSYEKSRGLLMITYLHPEYSKAKEILNNLKK